MSAYLAADVHIFPFRQLPNDPEGFGMVAIEAATHGLPTVAFATGGIVDAVSENISGHLIEPGNYKEFASAVLDVLSNGKAMRNTCIEFSNNFDWILFGKAVIHLLGERHE